MKLFTVAMSVLPTEQSFHTINRSVDESLNQTSNVSRGELPEVAPTPPEMSVELRIALYAVIFVLSFVGNVLVIVTLIQNKRMRTVTNVFLLNLAVSDLLLGVFCMPFTLVGSILRTFIFGAAVCTILAYLQAVSVAVSSLTLVAISLERCFAICQPLLSRRWQTLSHAYKMIGLVWFVSATVPLPIAVYSRHQALSGGRYNCRERWPSEKSEEAFTLMVTIVLYFLPLLVMFIAYTLIAVELWGSTRLELKCENQEMTVLSPKGENKQQNRKKLRIFNLKRPKRAQQIITFGGARTRSSATVALTGMRATNSEKALANKRKVIKMLFAVVLEFFICWTPINIINLWAMYDSDSAYSTLSPTAISYLFLLGYCSSCCNPITYCFMNKRFRVAFLAAFGCPRKDEAKQTDVSWATTATNVNGIYKRGNPCQKGSSSSSNRSQIMYVAEGIDEDDV